MSGPVWTAAEVRDALRRRHPAVQGMGVRTVPGPWTCIEELLGCDLVAFSAHQRPQQIALVGRVNVPYPRIGYEIKVSRQDLRQELLDPYKRVDAVHAVHAFYIATPKGLLTDAEKEFVEPVWSASDWVREPCTAGFISGRKSPRCTATQYGKTRCPECAGKGYIAKSLVEKMTPYLWVPRDVGLIEVYGSGENTRCHVVREAPVNKTPKVVDGGDLGNLVRYVSAHPDPRHEGVVAADRALSKELRDEQRRIEKGWKMADGLVGQAT